MSHMRLVSYCRFCHHPLTDPRSIEAGYGPICAINHGLPWGDYIFWPRYDPAINKTTTDNTALKWFIIITLGLLVLVAGSVAVYVIDGIGDLSEVKEHQSTPFQEDEEVVKELREGLQPLGKNASKATKKPGKMVTEPQSTSEEVVKEPRPHLQPGESATKTTKEEKEPEKVVTEPQLSPFQEDEEVVKELKDRLQPLGKNASKATKEPGKVVTEP